jgi:hypothetical protein
MHTVSSSSFLGVAVSSSPSVLDVPLESLSITTTESSESDTTIISSDLKNNQTASREPSWGISSC